eukprot:s983_g24.t1
MLGIASAFCVHKRRAAEVLYTAQLRRRCFQVPLAVSARRQVTTTNQGFPKQGPQNQVVLLMGKPRGSPVSRNHPNTGDEYLERKPSCSAKIFAILHMYCTELSVHAAGLVFGTSEDL